MLKRKHFSDFLSKRETGDEQKAIFEMKDLGKKLEYMEMDLQAEMAKFQNVRKNKPGVKSNNVQKTSSREILHMSKVISHPGFQADPFVAVKTHLLNNLN